MPILLLVAAIVLTGCSTVPPQTAILSAELSKAIGETKRANLVVLDEWNSEKRGRIDDYMRWEWTPKYIIKFSEKIDFKKAVCAVKGDRDRAYVIQEIVEVISKKVAARRMELLKALEKHERKLRRGLRRHYGEMERMNSAITSNLKSAVKGKQLQKEFLKSMGASPALADPMEAAGEELDRLMK